MDDAFSTNSKATETIDTEIIKTHFPRDCNDKIVTFGKNIT